MSSSSNCKMEKRDPDEMNDKRAEWADQALCLFQARTYCDSGEECLKDLLTNLRHWADRANISWDSVLASAMDIYWGEVDLKPVSGKN